MTRYRFTTVPTGARQGPWRKSRREAEEDAIAANCGEHDPDTGRIDLDLMVEIEERKDVGE